MSDIFVDEKELFDVKVYYTINDETGNMVVFGNSEVADDDVSEMKSITFNFRYPDWILSRTIMRSGRVNVEGEILIDTSQLHASLFQFLCVDWDVVDGDGSEIEFSYEKLVTVRPDIARCAINELQTILIEKGIWRSLLDS